MRRIPRWLEDQREGGTDVPPVNARLTEELPHRPRSGEIPREKEWGFSYPHSLGGTESPPSYPPNSDPTGAQRKQPRRRGGQECPPSEGGTDVPLVEARLTEELPHRPRSGEVLREKEWGFSYPHSHGGTESPPSYPPNSDPTGAQRKQPRRRGGQECPPSEGGTDVPLVEARLTEELPHRPRSGEVLREKEWGFSYPHSHGGTESPPSYPPNSDPTGAQRRQRRRRGGQECPPSEGGTDVPLVKARLTEELPHRPRSGEIPREKEWGFSYPHSLGGTESPPSYPPNSDPTGAQRRQRRRRGGQECPPSEGGTDVPPVKARLTEELPHRPRSGEIPREKEWGFSYPHSHGGTESPPSYPPNSDPTGAQRKQPRRRGGQECPPSEGGTDVPPVNARLTEELPHRPRSGEIPREKEWGFSYPHSLGGTESPPSYPPNSDPTGAQRKQPRRRGGQECPPSEGAPCFSLKGNRCSIAQQKISVNSLLTRFLR